ncbi:Putative glucoamylase [Granulicella rosea]|uniref:Putative glucoamylase n=1 Tax=Granulicella rosea TaxID=474952 RepID=A0A239KTE1_9BACT|nr:glucoamylase family protein [Granulicella rosea]SNT21300.1 Putative glucoamylase [Granulicella rosea]
MMAETSEEFAPHALTTAQDLPVAGLPEAPSVSDAALREHADATARGWHRWAPVKTGDKTVGLELRLKRLSARLKDRLAVCKAQATKELTPQLELLESTRMMQAAVTSVQDNISAFADLPRIRLENGDDLPRVANLSEEYLSIAGGIWSGPSLTTFVNQAQAHDPLLANEIAVLPQTLKLAQLEYILDRADEVFASGEMPPIEQSPFSAPLHSMRRMNQVQWRKVLEPMIAFDAILRQDPAGVFAYMEDETRNNYHVRISELALHADFNEVQTAQAALDLAREAAGHPHADPRYQRRLTHIGYYLFAEGLSELEDRIGYHMPADVRLRRLLKQWNEEVYILGNFSLSLFLIVAVMLPLVPNHAFWAIAATLLLALIPATQGGVEVVNSTVLALLKAESLPKLDYLKSVPADAATLVVIPTLLLHEKQVRELLEELEARYLSNQDEHIHFGLLTDLPDSPVQPPPDDLNPLVQFAIHRIEELNAKYAHESGGVFLLLHRYRVYNQRQGAWMGWERKRGKLLDLNKLILGEYDSFPLKAGPVQALRGVRYVITLDSDTQLPRGTAARMIGTMAHPLNEGIIDPKLKIVTAGYGILQPRVGVSVASASVSRLSALYSGETGFDIYTRAVSDVYQDLFGEGIFAGKGIYEVSVLHSVLDKRFPRNSLLSHDLIEGSYARAGLLTDVEIIDDYPSHYSAHTKRKHRWVRGDWQVARWLFNKVPDDSRHLVDNPISNISRWKIFDNLRRSLVEPFTFLMLFLGWFILPGGPVYWTIVTIVLLLLPVVFQLAFNFGRALLKLSFVGMRESVVGFAGSFGFTMLNLTFLPHHMLLSMDAIVRAIIRTYFSGRQMLEWETAAQAEAGARSGKTTPVDIYLQVQPAMSLAIAVLLSYRSAAALLSAAPVLILWALAPLIAQWLNAAPRKPEGPLESEDRLFLEAQALSIWRYFAEFGDERNHWLIPDNVEERNMHQVRKLSPTNLGMLFNARQAAYEFGFLTLPEFARATLGTLATYDALEKVRGHIYNWYDIETLKAIPPFTVSAVDSGNLAAGLYTLHTGALDLMERPYLTADTLAGASRMREAAKLPGVCDDGQWIEAEAARRDAEVASVIEQYAPWLMPQYDSYRVQLQIEKDHVPALQEAPERVSVYAEKLAQTEPDGAFVTLLREAGDRLMKLRADLQTIASEAYRHADAMEYGFLLLEKRMLLSIGYDGPTGVLHDACYDLLASEARIASFLAVAKGDIPQQCWFKLDRSHVLVDGRPALLSWTGTMFEYLMPTLWMRTFPNTLITRTLESAVRIQKDHVKNMPWGISESGFAKTDSIGRYGYQAFGIPDLALKYGAEDGPVISPYSTFLTLSFLRRDAIANLRRMAGMGWVGAYGFYEAADYTQSGSTPALVRSWMAHHQGMSLLAVTNLLRGNIFQTWFHANPRVRAAELLLHEKPLSKETLRSLEKQTAVVASAPKVSDGEAIGVGH